MPRVDSIGMFWQDIKKEKQRGIQERPAAVLPAIPETDWQPPEFKDLSSAKIIGVDFETNDPTIKTRGCGAFRDGYAVGVSVSTDDGYKAYFPFAHSMPRGEPSPWNMDKDTVMAWLREQMSRPEQMKVGANILYDLEYMAANDVHVAGEIYDILNAEPLLDENQFRYSLEDCAQKWLGESKIDEDLYLWSSRAYGGSPVRKSQAANIWRCPVELVGPYAEADADLPIRILRKQWAELSRQNLLDVFKMECKLIRVLLLMRMRGVNLDMEHAQNLRDEFEQKLNKAQGELNSLAGYSVSVSIDDDLVRLFEKNNMPVPRTDKGNPSFERNGLNRLIKNGNPTERAIAKSILDVRRYDKAIGTFLDGYIFGLQHNGRLYTQFHQLRSDEGGTVSGRFSSSLPNLQNIPSRDKQQRRIRECFVPDEGHKWIKDDYSSVEPRYLMHFASGEGAEEMRERYRKNPGMDFYLTASEAAQIDRTPAKQVALADMYGQGIYTLSAILGVSKEEAQQIKDIMVEANPYIRHTFNQVMRTVQRRGYIFTISGRRRRWDKWAAKDFDLKMSVPPFDSRDEAMRYVKESIENAARAKKSGNTKIKIPRGGVERAFGHKGLNALLQGSSADHMKKAMVDIYEAGIMDVLGAPLLTVHDELDWSADVKDPHHIEALNEGRILMQDAYKLRVPILVDRELGDNWSNVSEDRWNELEN